MFKLFCTALGTECNRTTGVLLNKTQISLNVPKIWDGPTGIELPMPITIIGVITAFFLVCGSIYTFATI